MSVRPPVPPIQTSGLASTPPPLPPPHDRRKPPPPPPPPSKSPLRTSSSQSNLRSGTAMTRRRTRDGKLVKLNIPTPLSALDPSTPPVAEEVRTHASEIARGRGLGSGRASRGKGLPQPPPPTTSPTSPGATLAAMKRQTKELQTRYHARPASPLRLQSAKREAKREGETASKHEEKKRAAGAGARPSVEMKRQSSLGRLTRRVSSTASSSSANLRDGLRKSLRKSSSFGGGVSSAAQGLSKRRSLAKLARRESAKLKSILRISHQLQVSADTEPPGSPHIETAATTEGGTASTGPQPGTTSAFVAQKEVGASWHPPRRDLDRRQSVSKLRNLAKPYPNLNAPAMPDRNKPPAPTYSIKKPPPSQQTNENTSVVAKRSQPEQPVSKGRDGRDILSEISQKHLSASEARRLIRQHNREYFRSRIWDPALQKDFVGAYQLANQSDTPPGSSGQNGTQSQSQSQPQSRGQAKGHGPARKHDSAQTLVGSYSPPEKEKEKNPWKRYENPAADVEEWARSVQHAMERLENKIRTEAISDPIKFMKARRESAQLRAWIAAQRRTSEARMSAIAMGRVRPGSPFEQAFVAELLRENEIRFKHSSNPIEEAEKLFQDYNNKKNSLLPHYVPFSRYPLLTSLEDIEIEAKAENTLEDERPRRRFSMIDEKKAARRAGREYKSPSTTSQLDQLEMHETRCCGLWKRKAFVDKIS